MAGSGPAARWVASRWALRTLLSRYLDEDPAAIALASGEHGKPALAEAPERLAFNLSHSGDLAIVAVAAGREVGVDVEAIDPARDLVALARRGLDADSAASVRAAAPAQRARVFYEAWARHEALVKCLGTGLGAAPTAHPPVEVSLLEVGAGHAAALAVESAEPVAHRCFSLGDAR